MTKKQVNHQNNMKYYTDEEKQRKLERISRYEEDLTDAQKSYEDSLRFIEDAVEWKYKMMEALVVAHKKLQDLKDEE